MSDERWVLGIAVEDRAVYARRALVDREWGKIRKRGPQKQIERVDFYDRNTLRRYISRLVKVTQGEVDAVGISMFGVIRQDDERDPSKQRHRLIAVPRDDWRDRTDAELIFKDIMPEWHGIPVAVRNDCTTYGLSEFYNLQRPERDKLKRLAFVRLGKGIGASVIYKETVLEGRVHAEMGHIPVTPHPKGNLITGSCISHGKCLEGLVSEKAILDRVAGQYTSLDQIPEDALVWDIVAFYVAQLCAVISMLHAPDCIIIGGQTMVKASEDDASPELREHLYDDIRSYFRKIVGDYPKYEELSDLAAFIRPAQLWEDHASMTGAIEIAKRALFPAIRNI